jgi:isohexenylglutaconyl-CoA hydratase
LLKLGRLKEADELTGFPTYETLRLARAGWRVDLTLDRPERRNALTFAMMREIGDAVGRVAASKGVRVLVLRGAGGNFCAGGDIGFMAELPPAPTPGDADPLAAEYRYMGEALERLNALPQAVVAVVEGACVGGGLGMACCADVVLAEAGAKFGMPEPRAGFIPSQIIPFVVRRIGEARARRLAVLGAVLDGAEAVAAGIAHHCEAGTEALEARLAQVQAEIGRCEPGAVAEVKRLVLCCAMASDAAVMDDAAASLVALLRRPEAAEGMAAFHDKRPPAWAK